MINDPPRKRKMVAGVGINDSPYIVSGSKIFRTWQHMIKRCYGAKKYYASGDQRCPTYEECEVCDEWKIYTNFEKWMLAQDWKGKTLDKDLLAPERRGKLYSPERCCFISRQLNSKITHIGKRSPNNKGGTFFDKNKNKFIAQAAVLGKTIRIGAFDKIEDAKQAFKEFAPKAAKIKAAHLRAIAKTEPNKKIKKGLNDLAKKLVDNPDY